MMNINKKISGNQFVLSNIESVFGSSFLRSYHNLNFKGIVNQLSVHFTPTNIGIKKVGFA